LTFIVSLIGFLLCSILVILNGKKDEKNPLSEKC